MDRAEGKDIAAFGPLAVSPGDGARIAGVGRTKFYEALSSGSLKSIKFGRRRLVRVGPPSS